MKIYLDNCCFNRPFDDQTVIRNSLEAQAKLYIQRLISERKLDFVWSYVLSFENENNPHVSKKISIRNFSQTAAEIILEKPSIIADAIRYQGDKIRKLDSLHLACAKDANVDFFLTTDDQLLDYQNSDVRIINPTQFVILWAKEAGNE